MITINPQARAAHVAAIRRFNRLYTQRIQLLDKHMLNSKLSLPEARVLFEIGHRASSSGAALARTLQLDPGYMSRILARLQRGELLMCTPSPNDGRRREYSLSPLGQQTFDALGRAAQDQIGSVLDELCPHSERELMQAVSVLQRILGNETGNADPIVLREHEAGDMGWIIQRHAQLYHYEYAFDATFEALCARITAEFIDNLDAAAQRCWIAVRGEQRLGSVLVMNADNGTAQIRLFLVEPQVRGLGLGRLLIRECIRFAARHDYQRITLWTNDNLHAARHIYAGEGFELVSSEAHHSFGHDLIGENWQRALP